MFKIFAILVLVGGIFAYFKFSPVDKKISLPQFPQNLTQVDLSSFKNQTLEAINKYFPETATQSVVLGTTIKNESLNLVIDAARKLSPADFATLQQFICEPKK